MASNSFSVVLIIELMGWCVFTNPLFFRTIPLLSGVVCFVAFNYNKCMITKIYSSFKHFFENTNILLWIATIEGVFVVPAVALQLVRYTYINSKLLAIVNLSLVIIMVLRYKLWNMRVTWLLALFLAWTYATSLYRGTDLLKTFGCVTLRAWYLAILLCFVAIVLEKKWRKRWLYSLMAVGLTSESALFVIFISKATDALLHPEVETDTIWGLFKNGRIHAMSNANTVGIESAASVLMAVWLLLTSISNYKKAKESGHKFNAVCSMTGIVIWGIEGLISVVMLSLSGSRGSILATGLGMAVITFGSIWAKKKTKGACKIFLSMGMAVAAVAITVGIAYIPNKLYTVSANHYVADNASDEIRDSEDIGEQLRPFGVTYEVGTFTDRTLIWKAVFKNMDDDPVSWLTGITVPMAPYVFVQDVYEGRPDKPAVHAHNGYIESLWLYGIPGAILLAVMLVSWIISGLKLFFSKDEFLGTERLVVAFAVAAMAEGMVEVFPFPFTVDWTLTFMFFIAAGTCIGINEKEKDGKTE